MNLSNRSPGQLRMYKQRKEISYAHMQKLRNFCSLHGRRPSHTIQEEKKLSMIYNQLLATPEYRKLISDISAYPTLKQLQTRNKPPPAPKSKLGRYNWQERMLTQLKEHVNKYGFLPYFHTDKKLYNRVYQITLSHNKLAIPIVEFVDKHLSYKQFKRREEVKQLIAFLYENRRVPKAKNVDDKVYLRTIEIMNRRPHASANQANADIIAEANKLLRQFATLKVSCLPKKSGFIGEQRRDYDRSPKISRARN